MGQELVDGRFRIGRVIGRGTTGAVHEAEGLRAPEGTPETSRIRCTVLRLTLLPPVRRVAREVGTMRLPHQPNLPRLVAGGLAADGAGPPYLAMEFLDGASLRDLAEEEPALPVAWAAAVGAESGAGLATEGSPRTAVRLPPERAAGLLGARATENTAAASAERTMARALGGPGALTERLAAYGHEPAAALDTSHRRVRQASHEIVRGLSVTARKPADVLGVYVCLPAAPAPTAGVSA